MRGSCRSMLLAAVLASVGIEVSAAQRPIPTPESVIGFPACADYKLASFDQSLTYLKELDSASPRLRLIEIGKTTEGRPHVLAIISSEENLGNLERYKTISARLAHARGLTDDEARSLAREGKTVVWVDFGQYSSAVGTVQAAPELAWRLVTDESPRMRLIREHVVFLLMPNLNPDGTHRVVNWYRAHGQQGYEPTQPPELTGLDNNRDWYMYNHQETRNAGRQVYHEWFPQIVQDHSQAGQFPARIFVPPFADPMNPNVPPLVMRGINIVGDAMSQQLLREGKTGVLSRVRYDTWWNGGMRTTPNFHNMIGILTETHHPSPFPVTYDPEAFPDTFVDGTSTRTPSTHYPSPFLGGEWHLRDSCEYMMSSSLAVLDIAAKRREEWLYGIYTMGRDAIAAGAGEHYIVPNEQRDPGTAVKMINVLRLGGVEVERATAPFAAGGRSYSAGTFLIRGAQAFLPYVRDLLNPQVYTYRTAPYDISGWTLPLQMGVGMDKVMDEAITGGFEPVAVAAVPAGRVTGRARLAYALDGRVNDAFRAVNRLLKAGETVYRTKGALAVGGATWPAGTFLVMAGESTHARVEDAATSLGLEVVAQDEAPDGELLRVRAPRVGLYRAWVTRGNADEGWTRWLLEKFEFAVSSIRDQELEAGDLRAKYDVILLPNARLESMLHGNAPGTVPPEFAGGMGIVGAANLYKFAAAGGTLVAMGQATELPVTTFGLPVQNVLAGVPASDFLVPGSILRVTIDTQHPIGFGMPEEAGAFFARGPAFFVGRDRTDFEDDIARDPAPPEHVRVVAHYPENPLLLSGWTHGEQRLYGRAAIVEAALEQGRVVLLGIRAQHRGQAHGTFKLLFNSVYLATSQTAAAMTHTSASQDGQ